MADLTRDARRNRTVTAFFDTQATAQKAVDDLTAAGLLADDIRLTEGAGTTAVTDTPVATEHKGFWAELKDLFLPDSDRYSYAEGLTRGGYLLSIQVDDQQYDRVLEILDADGAVDMDAREADWRATGWSGYDEDTTGRVRAMAPGASAATIDPATASSLAATDLVSPVQGEDDKDLIGTRDPSHGRTRLRSYVGPMSDSYERSVDVAPSIANPVGAGALAGLANPAGDQDLSGIAEHMDVIASDGATVGTVDHLDGPDRVKLARRTSPDGQHHFIPVAWIDHVDSNVHLNRTSEAVKAGW